MDPEDPIYQAMIAAAKAPPPVQPPIVKEPPIAVVAPPQARQAPIDRSVGACEEMLLESTVGQHGGLV